MTKKMRLEEAAQKLYDIAMGFFEEQGLTEEEIDERFRHFALKLDALRRKN